MKAIVSQELGGPIKLVTDRPEPALRPSYILVQPHAVALNPADNVYISFRIAGPGSLLGCDYAGTIIEVGSEVRKHLKPGDRVCGCTRTGDPDQIENGTFAQTICVIGNLAVRIPEHMSFEEAATTGVTILTTGICLYRKLDNPYPKLVGANVEQVGKDKILFVYGGSSAMGTMTIQFAKLSGFEVWTACSPRNHELVKSYGADKVWDYNDAAATKSITDAAAQHDGIKLCIDCISTSSTTAFCSDILVSGAIYSVIMPFTQMQRDDVTTALTMGYSFLGERWNRMGTWIDANQEDFEKAVEFAEVSEELLAESKIKDIPLNCGLGVWAA